LTDRSVVVRLEAQISDYMAKFGAAGKAAGDLAAKVDAAKAKSAVGFQEIGRAALIGGGAIVAGYGLAVHAMATFESKMALVRTLAHANATDMAQLRTAALTVGQAYGFSANEVADAEAELVKAGVSVRDIMGGALTGALTLAAAGQTDVAEATQIAATAMTQFQLTGKDVPHIADLLAAGADKALGSVGDLGYALDAAGPQAHAFGVSLEETVGTLAAFAQSGQIGERGGTVFSQMLLKLAAPGKQATAILQDLGIHTSDASGQFVGMARLAGELHNKMDGLTQAERTHDLAVIFGARAIRGANILYQEGAKGIEQWTKNVNDGGFAALQAAGKMDSLSGDIRKFETAFQSAFIGVGEGANGPLRGMVQDATGLVNVWNELPGPTRAAATSFVVLGGAVAAAGGAALLFIPKWFAMNAALKDTSIGAITTSRAVGVLGKTGGVIAGISALGAALYELHHELQATAPAADAYTNSIVALARTGQVTGKDFSDFTNELREFANSGWSGSVGGDLAPKLKSVDQALADMVTSGHLDMAKTGFNYLSTILTNAGFSSQRVASLFPALSKALADSATSANVAGNGIDQYGNKVASAGEKTRSATDAAKAYAKQLHAMADPLFAMNSALQNLRDKQAALTAAVKKHGADSEQARQAQLDLASASLDAAAASKDLTAAVKDGKTSLADAKQQLKAWVAAGILTKQQADAVAQSFGGLIDKAKHVSHELWAAAYGVKDAGKKIGSDFAAGMVIGIADSQPAVEAQASKLAMSAAAAAAHAQDSHSPSRVAMRLGSWWGEGYWRGIASQSDRVGASAGRLARIAALAATKGSAQDISDAITKLTALTDKWNALNQKQDNARQRVGLVSDLSKAQAAYDKALHSGKKSDIAQARTDLVNAQKALADFDRQAHRDAVQAAADRAQARLQHKQDLEQNKESWLFENLSTAKQIQALGEMMSSEKKYSDQWLQHAEQRRSLIQQERDAEQQKAQAAQQAAQAEAQTVATNRDQWAFEHMSEQQQLAFLDGRLAKETQYSDQWLQDAQQREQIAAQIAQEEQQAVDDAASKLNQLLDERDSILKQLADAQTTYTQAVTAATAALASQTDQIRQNRIESLAAWSQITQQVSSVADQIASQTAPSMAALVADAQNQVQQFTDWMVQLQQARDRGLTDATITALGLDQGPAALAQLQQINAGTLDQIDELNTLVAQKVSLASQEVGREQQGMFGQVGQQLLDAQATFNDAVTQAQSDFLKSQADLTAQLNTLGQEQGRTYTQALAEALASGLPGVVAAAQALQAVLAGIGGAAGSGSGPAGAGTSASGWSSLLDGSSFVDPASGLSYARDVNGQVVQLTGYLSDTGPNHSVTTFNGLMPGQLFLSPGDPGYNAPGTPFNQVYGYGQYDPQGHPLVQGPQVPVAAIAQAALMTPVQQSTTAITVPVQITVDARGAQDPNAVSQAVGTAVAGQMTSSITAALRAGAQ
jgi:TP901 family phage tail tape measure protein